MTIFATIPNEDTELNTRIGRDGATLYIRKVTKGYPAKKQDGKWLDRVNNLETEEWQFTRVKSPLMLAGCR